MTDKITSEVQLVFNDTAQHVRTLRGQQIQVTYLTFLLYGGIVVLYDKLHLSGKLGYIAALLPFAAATALITSSVFIFSAERAIRIHAIRLANLHEKFEEAVRELYKVSPTQNIVDMATPFKPTNLVFFLVFWVVVAGLSVTAYVTGRM